MIATAQIRLPIIGGVNVINSGRCVCGHSDEMHFRGVKEGYTLYDSACCQGNCACGRYREEWDDLDIDWFIDPFDPEADE